jgi:thioredoxin reductase/Pyruvate/2-oxoacid:ferredoxin oxidoreductase delta subunit
MNTEILQWVYYSIPIVLIVLFATWQSLKQSRNRAILENAVNEGLTEPASLHPVIEVHKCIGCASCITACPEGNVLGLIQGKSTLINPTHCIGHGACKKACPVDAISLVFGTEKRGVDIPMVKVDFETNVPGIYIAGELGGMGLIRNAVEQGRQAMDAIAANKGGSGEYDVIIIGAGPAGFSATLGAKQKGLRYLTIEQDSLGGTVFNFPRGKVVMTQPMQLPVVGKIKIRETTKEALLAMWQEVEKKTGIRINYQENMQSISAVNDGFEVNTSKGTYTTAKVLLAIGRRGTPRKLGVPGEELPKVVYRLIDPQQYRGQKVLVVGGGDSALEAACSIAEQEGTHVTVSYRSDAFSRAKEKNRQKIEQAEQQGRIRLILKSNVKKITQETVEIDQEGTSIDIENDAVIVSAGGILPTPMLKEIGIEVETKHGTA